MKKIASSLTVFLLSLAAFTQDFQFEAKLNKVEKKAYYKVVLSPELLGKLNQSMSDIRLYDESGEEKAYFVQKEPFLSTNSLFKEYKILDKLLEADTISYLVFHNPDKKAIDNVSFFVKNTTVRKRARLSGSNDRQNWFVIKDDYLLHSMESGKGTAEYKMLHFPLSDYEFFRLEVNDQDRLPINILKVGYYDTEKVKGLTTEFGVKIETQKDSAKTTYVKVSLPNRSYLEQLKFEVSGAEFYSRRARILVKKEALNRKKKKVVKLEEIASVHLNSNSLNEFKVGSRVLKTFYIEVENNDDQPLVFEKVTASYLNHYLVAELSPSHQYLLKFGNPKISAPSYDIQQFKNKIKVSSSKIVHQKIERKVTPKQTQKGDSIFESAYFIWSIIILVGLILGVISFKMIRELGDQKEN